MSFRLRGLPLVGAGTRFAALAAVARLVLPLVILGRVAGVGASGPLPLVIGPIPVLFGRALFHSFIRCHVWPSLELPRMEATHMPSFHGQIAGQAARQIPQPLRSG